MKELLKSDGYWTKQNCILEALKYKYRSEFKKKCSGAYNVCVKNKWLDDVCTHMIKPQIHNKYWTKELCLEKSLKCFYRKEFENTHPDAYQAAQKYGWLDEICSHMFRLGSKVKRMIYACEFSDNHVYVGLTYNSKRRKNEHFNPREYTKSSVYLHITKTNLIPRFVELTEYIDVNKAILKEEEYVSFYRDKGWNILNKIKTGGLGKTIN
jgi:predicted GIY-YIG superfamily endonuclease